MDLRGTFCGLVEDNKDPEKLGRLKVRVAHVYGAVGGVFGAITTNDIPWALPAGLPNGMSQQSGGADWLPEVGDQVLVRFLDAEPEKPVWEWFMQSQAAAKSFPLHSYADGSGGSVGKPKRGAWVRYGHTVEWNTDGLILTTSKGYRLLLTDSSEDGNDGDITIETQAGQSLDFDDSVNGATLNVNEDFNINVGKQMLALCDSISLQSQGNEIELISGKYLSIDTETDLKAAVKQDWTMDVTRDTSFNLTGKLTVKSEQDISMTAAVSLSLKSTADMSLTATGGMTLSSTSAMTIKTPVNMTLDFLQLSLGNSASSPYVLGDQLFAYLESLFAILAAHTHSGVLSGGASTGPMTPTPTPPLPTMLSQFIRGK